MSFFCFRLLNCASRVTSRSPCAAITRARPSFRSTKNGLFIVWNVTTKRRPLPDAGASGAAGLRGRAAAASDRRGGQDRRRQQAESVLEFHVLELGFVSALGSRHVRVHPGRPGPAVPGRAARGQEEAAGGDQGRAVIVHGREHAEGDGPDRRGDAADIVAEPGARGAEQGREQRRQVHREQGEQPREDADDRQQDHQAGVAPRHAVGRGHREEVPQAHQRDGPAVAQAAGQVGRGEVARDRGEHDQEHRQADELSPLSRGPGGQVGQAAEVEQRPEHEGPVRGQRGGADEDDQDRGPAQGRAGTGRRSKADASPADAAASLHSAGSGTSRRIQKTSQAGSTPTRKTSRGLVPAIRKAATEASRMPTFTADWSTAASQGRHRRGQVSESSEAPMAHSPPIPRRRQEPEDQEMPPGLRDRGQPGEEGIGQDRQRQRPAAAQAIAEPAEEAAAQRPAQQERRLDQRAVPAHSRDRSGRTAPAAWPRTAPRPAYRGACPGRRTASPARPPAPISTARPRCRGGPGLPGRSRRWWRARS